MERKYCGKVHHVSLVSSFVMFMYYRRGIPGLCDSCITTAHTCISCSYIVHTSFKGLAQSIKLWLLLFPQQIYRLLERGFGMTNI